LKNSVIHHAAKNRNGLPRKARTPRLPWLGSAVLLTTLVLACKGGGAGANAVAKVGDVVSFDDSDWVVVSAMDLGAKIKPTGMFAEDKATGGHFVEVQYKVTSKQKEEDTILDGPKLKDSKGRQFTHLEDESSFVPSGQKTIVLEKLPPSMAKEFWTIFEVPADATEFQFEARSLGLSAHEKPVALGALQPAPAQSASAQAAAGTPGGDGTSVCARARACCEALSPKGSPGSSACGSLTNAPEATCETSVNSFKQAASKTHNKAAMLACK
jgi:hypothetical protein